jgi:1-acyl-sn-glycerol-3-phosphate acyltransferase
MATKSKIFLQLQNFIARVTIIFIAPLYFLIIRLFFYRVRGLEETRRQCAVEFAKHKGPWIICANHLTMIDSFILAYSTFSLGRHFASYRRLPWNLPERSNFQRNIILAALCYLAKCIPIDRGGPREKMKNTMDKCIYLLRDGQNIQIFPEGGRSRTGRVNTEGFSYGVGRFVKELENCKVMCIYLRGDKQAKYGIIPVWGEKFFIQMEVFSPLRSTDGGLRAQRGYAAQIINRLAQMEERYFASYRKRYCGLEGPGQCAEKPGFAISKEDPHHC